MVGYKNLTRGSLIGITRLADGCRSVIPSDRFFYPDHTPMIDTLSCIPFDLPHLIFNKELAIKQHFSVKEFLLMFNEIGATSDRRSVLYVSV